MTSELPVRYVRQAFVMALLAIVATQSSESVIMTPRFSTTPPEPLLTKSSQEFELDSLPHQLSINEGQDINVKVRSKSAITINLNQAVPEDVIVLVKVYSGFDQIEFTHSPASNHSTQLIITYIANTFGDRVIDFKTTERAGHAEIVCQVLKTPNQTTLIDDSSAYISVNIFKSSTLDVVIGIVGWIYFIAWSASFYFQVILNYQRKSVIGLNFDFLALNLLGFTCYSIYNFTLMFSRDVEKEYYEKNKYGRIPVEYNDLFFAVHAFILTLITVLQCFIYERGNQKVSVPAGAFLGLTSLAGLGLYITSLFSKVTLLDVVLYLSYVKLAITVIKYVPQAYMNYKRKATTGWSIHNILLDFTGGLFSLAQMFFLSYNYDDWISIFGNFTKFGLGAISICFDIIFVVQHYILYKQVTIDTSDEAIPGPVISEPVHSTSYRQRSEESDEPTE